MGLHELGCPAQVHPDSTWHVAEHPSPLAVLLSSQTSEPAMIPSPQEVLQIDGSPEQV